VSAVQQITVLGATGSIGLSTLDVIARHPERYRVFGLTGFSRLAQLQALCLQHRPRFAVVPDADSARALQGELRAAGLATEVLEGEEGLCAVSADAQVDCVMAAISGGAQADAGGGAGWQEGAVGQQGGAGDVRRPVHAGGQAERCCSLADR